MSEVKNYFGRDLSVIMFDGSIKSIEHIKIGDILIGPDSKPKTVLTAKEDKKELIRFKPSRNGFDFSLGIENDLILSHTGKILIANHGETVNTTVSEFLLMSKNRQKYLTGYRSKCIHWNESLINPKISLPPYYLGAWLGDGTAANTEITNMDQEVIDYVYELAKEYNLFVSSTKKGRAYMLYLSCGKTGGVMKGKNKLLTQLQELKLIKNKHFPANYLYLSEKDRLLLLAGYLDTDGCLTDEYFVVSSVLDSLAEGVCFLARSLGFSASRKKRLNKYPITNETLYNYVSICGDVQRIPTKIARKKAKDYQRKRNHLKFGFKTELLTNQNCYGIVLDGDGLFLASDFTVLKAL